MCERDPDPNWGKFHDSDTQHTVDYPLTCWKWVTRPRGRPGPCTSGPSAPRGRRASGRRGCTGQSPALGSSAAGSSPTEGKMFKMTAQSHAWCIAHPVGGGVLGKSQHLTRPRQDRHLGGKMFKSTAQSHAHLVGGGVRGKAQLLDRPRQDRHLGGKSVKKFQIEICCRQLGNLALCIWSICCSCRCT